MKGQDYRRAPASFPGDTGGAGDTAARAAIHNDADLAERAIIYQAGTRMSAQKGWLPLLPMPTERYCADPKCKTRKTRQPLAADRHVDVMYCNSTCVKRHRRALDKPKIKVANSPLSPKNNKSELGHPTQIVDIVEVSPPTKKEFISRNTYREVWSFRDNVFGRLYLLDLITFPQFDAVNDYLLDLDEVGWGGGSLRAPHRDKADTDVWVPREPDSKYATPLARIKAANQAMGRSSTELLHAALVTNTTVTIDLETLRAVLDQLIKSRNAPWTTPRANFAIRSLSHSPALPALAY
jgi:hypothetical protein